MITENIWAIESVILDAVGAAAAIDKDVGFCYIPWKATTENLLSFTALIGESQCSHLFLTVLGMILLEAFICLWHSDQYLYPS